MGITSADNEFGDYVWHNQEGWHACIQGVLHGPYAEARDLVQAHREWVAENFFGLNIEEAG